MNGEQMPKHCRSADLLPVIKCSNAMKTQHAHASMYRQGCSLQCSEHTKQLMSIEASQESTYPSEHFWLGMNQHGYCCLKCPAPRLCNMQVTPTKSQSHALRHCLVKVPACACHTKKPAILHFARLVPSNQQPANSRHTPTMHAKPSACILCFCHADAGDAAGWQHRLH